MSKSINGFWSQIGNDIDGERHNDWSGYSCAMSADGKTILVGAPYNSENGYISTGQARLLKLNATTNIWEQIGPDLDGAERFLNLFGSSVAMSMDGSTIAVGAIDGVGNNPGFVRVYKLNLLLRKFEKIGPDIVGVNAGDLFGHAIAISADGTKLAVGSAFNYGAIRLYTGYVRVYKINSSDKSWEQIGPDITGDVDFDLFGTSLTMSSDGASIALGAISNNGNVVDANYGHVRILKLNSSLNVWEQIGSDIYGESIRDRFGISTAMSANGTIIVIGAPRNSGNGDTAAGQARVYKFYSPLNEWTQIGPDIDGEAIEDYFGTTVTMSNDGTIIAVGAPNNDNDSNSYLAGHVRVLQLNWTSNRYEQIGADIDGGTFNDQSGSSIAMSSDGKTIAIGAIGSNQYSGRVRVYQYMKCNDISWNLYNSQSNGIVASLFNRSIITNPSPCNRTNIEAVVPCNSKGSAVVIELYKGTSNKLLQRRTERDEPYFLFGNNGINVYNGRIVDGTYRIRAIVNGTVSPFLTFTLRGRNNCK
jgi:hypothetical protein